MDGDKTEGAVESKCLSRRPMDIWISVFGTERLKEPGGFNQSIYGRGLLRIILLTRWRVPQP